ncbi:MAG: outer membrane protein assembly factor [Ignavibacteriaceae bacterium]|nr:outer membrane protein assembly factor [Ignavibacteriaceae bacterium]
MKIQFKRCAAIFVLFNVLYLNLYAQNDSTKRAGFEWLPIVSYDTDAGFGYGVKTFFYDQLNSKESFDLILFNSTKGEQWYKFVFSTPDFESRQGTKYPLAIDLIFEYDKWKNYKLYYYGWDNESLKFIEPLVEYKDECVSEIIETKIVFNHAFQSDLTGFLAFKFKSISIYDVRRDSVLENQENIENKFLYNPSVKYLSVNLNGKWDTRNSYINPSRGIVLEADLEFAPDIIEKNSSFFRQGFIVRYYTELFFKNLIFASRAMEQVLISGSESSQFLAIPVGGNSTLRGVPADKYRFNSAFLLNSELRFPIWWRFGGIGGVDIGYGSNKDLYPENEIDWIINPVVGLRFFMDNFIVRADVGFYKDDIGFYLNFGHIY